MRRKKYPVHLPPYKVQPLTQLQALKELTNWAFIKFRIRELWKYTQGDGVKVMILDTGIGHKDIKIEKAKDFTGEGIEDKNGHGCLTGETEIYISKIGPSTLKEIWDNTDSKIIQDKEGEVKSSVNGFKTLSLNGFTNIQNLYRMKQKGKFVEIETSLGKFKATSWHKFFTARFLAKKTNRLGNKDSHLRRYNGYEIKEIEAEDLEVGDILIGMKLSRDLEVSTTLNTDFAYLAGEIEGDGTIINSRKKAGWRYEIRIFDKSKEQLEQISEVIKRLGPSPYIRKSSNTNGYELGFVNKKLVKSFSKFVFADTFGNFEQICAWLAGFFDAEGNFDKKKKRVRITNNDYNLLLSIQKILRIFGIKATIHRIFSKEHVIKKCVIKSSESFQLYIPNTDLFYNLIKPYTLSGKITQGVIKNYFNTDVMSIDLRALARIRKIEIKDGEDYFYDLCTETQNYSANGMIVHNTWVAGCVRATGGFLGKVPKCKLYVGKILSNTGEGAWMWMQKGLEWALEEKVDVINISAGGTYQGDAIQPILKKLADKGVLIICAAGNANSLLIFPASDMHTIAVGAITKEEQRAAFSNFGPRLIVMAPGVDSLGCYLNNGYAKMTGTSMASPETTCIVSLEKELRAMNLKEAIARFALTSKDMDEKGWDSKTGWGIVDPWKFLELEEPDKKTNFGWILKFIIFIILYIYFGGLVPVVVVIKKLFKKNKIK